MTASSVQSANESFKLVVVEISYLETGERGFFIGEPAVTAEYLANSVVVAGSTPVGQLLAGLRQLQRAS
jgi:hypothetical protein